MLHKKTTIYYHWNMNILDNYWNCFDNSQHAHITQYKYKTLIDGSDSVKVQYKKVSLFREGARRAAKDF